jgi:hypothetical protein
MCPVTPERLHPRVWWRVTASAGGSGLLRAISVIPIMFAALILRTDRRIVNELLAAQATSTGSAIPLDAPPIIGRWRLRRLASAGAICLVQPRNYYLQESGYAAYRKRRRRRVLVLIGILIPLIIITWVWLNLTAVLNRR